MNNLVVSSDRIVELGKAFRASKALFSAVELGVFSVLARGPRDLVSLRREVGVSERGARDFFDSLVALNLLERDQTGCYRNAPEADLFLDRNKPIYIGGELDHLNKRGYPHWHSLTTALRTGKPQSVAANGNYFLDVYADQAALELYTEGMTSSARLVAPAIATKFPWHRYSTFVDIGASQGGLPVEIARAHPHLTGGGFDLPPVRPRFDSYVKTHGFADRLSFYAGDFLRDPLPYADVMILGRVLHSWDLATKTALLRKAYDTLPPGGALIVYELMIDDGRRANAPALLASLNMLIMTDGGFDYTSADLKGWMHDANFRDLHFHRLTSELSMVSGMK
jgi:O-methyltransferase/methyltransferase family protein